MASLLDQSDLELGVMLAHDFEPSVERTAGDDVLGSPDRLHGCRDLGQGLGEPIAGCERPAAEARTLDVLGLQVDGERIDIGAVAAEDVAIVERLPAHLPRLIVHNKADLAGLPAHVEHRLNIAHVFASALTGEGIEFVERELLKTAHVDSVGEDAFIARERHLVALRAARTRLAAASVQIEAVSPALELFAEELRVAQQALSTITGEFTTDDLLGLIFSRFCIGK